MTDSQKECFDHAVKLLTRRMHSVSELRRKLRRSEWNDEDVEIVLADLQRRRYLDDRRYAEARALSAAERKQHGRRRAFMELRRAGVASEVADQALSKVYADNDSTAVARALIAKQASRLRKLDPQVARRRLVGMLQRRGFDYETVRPLIDEILKSNDDLE
jgi:regulatory protein